MFSLLLRFGTESLEDLLRAEMLQLYSFEHTEVSACSPDMFWVMSSSLAGFEDAQTHGGW